MPDPRSKYPTGRSAEKAAGADPHGRYRELCAIATTGTLTDGEWKLLRLHLQTCSECTRILQQFGEIERTAIPLLFSGGIPDDPVNGEPWTPSKARDELLSRVAQGHDSGWQEVTGRHKLVLKDKVKRPMRVLASSQSLRLAAGLVLAVVVGGLLYSFGISQGKKVTRPQALEMDLQREIEKSHAEKAHLEAGLAAKNIELENLSRREKAAVSDLASVKAEEKQGMSDLSQRALELQEVRNEKNAVTAERDELTRKLGESDSTVSSLKLALDRLRQERTTELVRTAALETHIADLSKHLREIEESNTSDSQLLASDRDIRELMGARELYIADVFDVDPESRTQKPYGRVFYTRGKSLIFYAFDLEQGSYVRNASAYQAWGRRGPHDERPVNMGIFYLDSDANRRWILKFDNPEVLAKIDTVFVTVEPKGGSEKPRGKPFLLASLKSQPNHP